MSKNKRAKDQELSELHAALAKALRTLVDSGEPNAAILNVARAFLKDNGIEAIPEKNDDLGAIRDSLPEFDDDDDMDGMTAH